jgi:hypothetical protein
VWAFVLGELMSAMRRIADVAQLGHSATFRVVPTPEIAASYDWLMTAVRQAAFTLLHCDVTPLMHGHLWRSNCSPPDALARFH